MPGRFGKHGRPDSGLPKHERPKPPEPSRQTTRALHTGSRAWRRLRAEVLVRDSYLCRACGKFGDQVDHRDGDSHNNDPGNLQCLCIRCHSAKTGLETGGFGSVLPKWLPKPRAQAIVVCGPPGAGKTTWALANANGRKVIDLDAIGEGMGIGRDRTLDTARRLLAMRNRQLAEAVERGEPFILIATAGSPRHREFWRAWGAKVVEIHPGVAVCIERIMNDPTRPAHVKERQARAVEAWK